MFLTNEEVLENMLYTVHLFYKIILVDIYLPYFIVLSKQSPFWHQHLILPIVFKNLKWLHNGRGKMLFLLTN